jgi:threonine/homoserine/homoserine lactone efflux protein
MGEMLGINELWLFVLSGLLLNVTPGPDTAYIIGRSIQLGWRGGAAAAIGICCGCLVHVFGAAIGLSALLMTSAAAFAVLKLAGAAYLVFTGLQMLLSRTGPVAEIAAQQGTVSLRRVFWQGP